MTRPTNAVSARGLASLRKFVRKVPEAERCDLCSVTIAEQHQHLLDPHTRRLLCTCDPCAILFNSNGQTSYRRVPRDIRHLSNFVLSDQGWNSLAIPIGLAFIYSSSVTNQMVAIYPSPAGPTESELDRDAWDEIAAENPLLANLMPDVEALLINRMNGARDYFLAPIDECYKLTGIVRKYWRGFSGGEEGFEQIRHFFKRLKERSYSHTEALYARTLV
jgi:Family of unknown function (DUF5947)